MVRVVMMRDHQRLEVLWFLGGGGSGVAGKELSIPWMVAEKRFAEDWGFYDGGALRDENLCSLGRLIVVGRRMVEGGKAGGRFRCLR